MGLTANPSKTRPTPHACLEKAPRGEQAYCLQTPGHPGTHQAYLKDALLEWGQELTVFSGPAPDYPSFSAA